MGSLFFGCHVLSCRVSSRQISGFEYTSKLQRMFVDKALSRDLHTGYVEWQASEHDV